MPALQVHGAGTDVSSERKLKQKKNCFGNTAVATTNSTNFLRTVSNDISYMHALGASSISHLFIHIESVHEPQSYVLKTVDDLWVGQTFGEVWLGLVIGNLGFLCACVGHVSDGLTQALHALTW
jgi:hypothetical protein